MDPVGQRLIRTLSIATTITLLLALALPVAAHVAPWQTRGAYWAPAPAEADNHGFALRLETVPEDPDDPRATLIAHHGSISFSPEEGTQADELAALSTDVYLEEGACAAGSPRFNVRVDADGDGSRDFFVQAYPAETSTGCPTGQWTTADALGSDAEWHVPGHGRLAPSSAATALVTDHPDHQITRIDLQWDNTGSHGPAVVWFDDISIHEHTFSEPVGTEVTCPGTVEDPVFGGFAACPFRVA